MTREESVRKIKWFIDEEFEKEGPFRRYRGKKPSPVQARVLQILSDDPSREARHVCFPWGCHNVYGPLPRTIRLMREAGWLDEQSLITENGRIALGALSVEEGHVLISTTPDGRTVRVAMNHVTRAVNKILSRLRHGADDEFCLASLGKDVEELVKEYMTYTLLDVPSETHDGLHPIFRSTMRRNLSNQSGAYLREIRHELFLLILKELVKLDVIPDSFMPEEYME